MRASADAGGCFPTGRHYPGIAHLIRAQARGTAEEFRADTPISELTFVSSESSLSFEVSEPASEALEPSSVVSSSLVSSESSLVVAASGSSAVVSLSSEASTIVHAVSC